MGTLHLWKLLAMVRAQVRSDQLAQIAKLASNGQVEVHEQIGLGSASTCLGAFWAPAQSLKFRG
jgi:hypothetical protein